MQNLSRSQITNHIRRLIARWPTDALRPSSISVQTFFQSRLTPPPAPETQPKSRWSQLFRKSAPPTPSPTSPLSPISDDAPLLSTQNVNALYSLLENRYQKKYPLPNSLRYPASQPAYYDTLLKEFEEAPHRSVLGRLRKKLSGVFRLK